MAKGGGGSGRGGRSRDNERRLVQGKALGHYGPDIFEASPREQRGFIANAVKAAKGLDPNGKRQLAARLHQASQKGAPVEFLEPRVRIPRETFAAARDKVNAMR